jgi:hypothetical protein
LGPYVGFLLLKKDPSELTPLQEACVESYYKNERMLRLAEMNLHVVSRVNPSELPDLLNTYSDLLFPGMVTSGKEDFVRWALALLEEYKDKAFRISGGILQVVSREDAKEMQKAQTVSKLDKLQKHRDAYLKRLRGRG